MNIWAVIRVCRLAMGFLCIGLSWSAAAQNVPGCGGLENAFGPFDYRDPEMREKNLNIVERRHFTPNVEMLQSGNTGHIMGDLDYTLRAWPNHHRALNSVGRYALQGGKHWPNPKVQSADCYFKRAIAWRPDDEVVRMLFGNYLARKGDRVAARKEYEEALKLSPSSAEINYNAGLFFVDEGDLERARYCASVAYAGGYPLPGLRKKIADRENSSRLER